jgi:hypothetical protein
MKITTNSIGNYGQNYLKPNPVNRNEQIQKTNTENISSEEKNFFAKLYPSQKDEILGYQFYNSKGKISGVHVGSLFDRRG